MRTVEPLAAAFPRESRFTLTPRAYCVEAARDAGKRGGYVAASRAFSNALAHAPWDKDVAMEFERSVYDIRKSRPFFQSPSRRRKQFQRGSIAPVEPEPEPDAPSSDDEEDDGPHRRRKAMKEFGELWMRLSRDIKEVMKKEEEADWGRLKDFLKEQYTVLKEVFQHYCALDAALGAPAGGGASKKAAGADDMYTMSALEWLEFAKDVGVVVARKGANPDNNLESNKKKKASAPSISKKGDSSKKVLKGGEELEGGKVTFAEEGEAGETAAEATAGDEAETEAAAAAETEAAAGAAAAAAAETTENSSGSAQAESQSPEDETEQEQENLKKNKKERPTVELPEEAEIEPEQVNEASLELIFVRANWERDESGKFIQDDSNPDHAMLMFEFVHGMLRLAEQTFPVRKDSPISLVDRFKTFWLNLVVPKAKRADIEGFRELMKAKSVQKILAKNEMRLHAVFMNYAAAEDDNDRQACMSLGEFSMLCEDAHMYCDHFKIKNAAAIYTHSQQDLDYDEVDPMVRTPSLWLHSLTHPRNTAVMGVVGGYACFRTKMPYRMCVAFEPEPKPPALHLS